jgi:crotonobetainyl-CoA:carnitine CoA-transferase CaiB-like acyl-CoA transferase
VRTSSKRRSEHEDRLAQVPAKGFAHLAGRTDDGRPRGALVDCDHPVAGKVRVVGPPARLSETPADVRLPAPLLGQHTDLVLRERLQLDDREIARLRSVGAIG